jgi:cell division protein FtsB
MTYLVQRLKEIDSEYGFTLCTTAADRIEQLERENAELKATRIALAKDLKKLTL